MDARDRIIEQRMAKRRRNVFIIKSIIALLVVLILVLSGVLINALLKEKSANRPSGKTPGGADTGSTLQTDKAENETEAVKTGKATEDLLAQAELMAAQYDYQGAINLLKAEADFNTNTTFQDTVAKYQTDMDKTVPYPVDEVTHVFFHTLVKDDAKAFDGDAKEAGYNQVMTTISEFNEMIQEMYDRGYVMVSVHDMCTVNDDGTVSKGEIRLPEGKTPFVLSQDDVSYYHYMDGDGFAQKLIVDENGDVKNTYIEDDGSISVGDYDMVPLIDTFVKQHPDFAYHGHKGIIALTGYEGVMGYRTDEVYKTRQEDRITDFQRLFFEANPDFDWDREVAEAKAVAEAMKAEGWEFASHTWGHINPVAYGYDSTVRDTQRWLDYVATVVGDTDVLIFAFGADINDWTPYTMDNPFFAYLKEHGFSIFCNVDGSAVHWVQFGSNYMRQGRRNLDGYRMYYYPEYLTDLFDVEKVWDSNRPTPVPQM